MFREGQNENENVNENDFVISIVCLKSKISGNSLFLYIFFFFCCCYLCGSAAVASSSSSFSCVLAQHLEYLHGAISAQLHDCRCAIVSNSFIILYYISLHFTPFFSSMRYRLVFLSLNRARFKCRCLRSVKKPKFYTLFSLLLLFSSFPLVVFFFYLNNYVLISIVYLHVLFGPLFFWLLDI